MSRLSEELRKRTKDYASDTIRFYVESPKTREEVRILGKQLLPSGTSVAAHAREASRARSDAEFCSMLDGLLQEADESQLWLESLKDDCGIAEKEFPACSAKRTNSWLSLPPWLPSRAKRAFDFSLSVFSISTFLLFKE